jgi:signal peptidase II
LAFIIGGALGNLIDRIRFDAVIDFIDWHIGDMHWPAFNIADMFIVIGVGLYIINLIFRKK